MPLSRRRFLAASAAAACIPLEDCAHSEPVGPSLKRLAARKGILFGSEVHGPIEGVGSEFGDPGYRQLLVRECAAIEPGIEMKWPVVEPRPGAFDFAAADRMVAFAAAHGLKMRGVNVVWMNAEKQPRWLAGLLGGAERGTVAERLLHDRAARACSRYGDRIVSWDVVNEAIDDRTGEPRPSVLAAALGGIEPVMDTAFHAARAAAPHAELAYCDFMSWEVAGARHRAGVLRLLEGFRRRGTPVDTLGIQGHLIGYADPVGRVAIREWQSFLDQVTAMGYRLAITEFDVDDRALPTLYAERDAAVAATARAYLHLTLGYPAVHTLMTWGLVDRYSWWQAQRPRTDHLARRPLPYDDALRPKPLRTAIARALAEVPAR